VSNKKQIQLERRFAIDLMRHLVVPTFVLDAKGNVIIWNKACERLTGIDAKDVLGTNNHWKAFYTEPRDCLADILVHDRVGDLDSLYACHAKPSDISQGLTAENWCIMPQADRRLYLAIDVGPILDEGGNLVAVVETLRDLTEKKVAEMALESLAHKDGLTGLANRRSFDMSLDSALLHAQKTREKLSLILCDIDHFKAYNDTYGHLQGDGCLRQVALAIEGKAGRQTDLVARYGGEEFAVILPRADSKGVKRVSERIRKAVKNLKCPHKKSKTSKWVTVSLGAVTLTPDEDTTVNQLIRKADKALYKAKSTGRNSTVVTKA